MSAVPSEDENMMDVEPSTQEEPADKPKVKRLPLVSLPLSIEFYDKLDPRKLER